MLGGDVNMKISSECLEGLHGVAIGVMDYKSIKIFELGPRTRIPTLAQFTFVRADPEIFQNIDPISKYRGYPGKGGGLGPLL